MHGAQQNKLALHLISQLPNLLLRPATTTLLIQYYRSPYSSLYSLAQSLSTTERTLTLTDGDELETDRQREPQDQEPDQLLTPLYRRSLHSVVRLLLSMNC